MTTKKKILVASTPDGQFIAEHSLADRYELIFATTIREAKQALLDGGSAEFAMIICGIHVDDSRMFELLQFVRVHDDLDSLPFLIFQAKSGTFDVMSSVKSMADTLGACGFLKLQDLPLAQAGQLLRKAVEDSLDKSVRSSRTDTKPEEESE